MRRYLAMCILGLLVVGCNGDTDDENNGEMDVDATADVTVDTSEDTDESDSTDSDADTGPDVLDPPEPDWDGICARVEYHNDESPAPEALLYRTYDDQGRLIKDEADYGADGSIDQVLHIVYHDVGTDQYGAPAYDSREIDVDGDGELDLRQEWDYDSEGRIQYLKWDVGIDDSFEFVEEFTYDEFGQLTSYVRDGRRNEFNSWKLLQEADGEPNYQKEFSWNGEGLPLEKKWDVDGDGEFEAVSTWEYDSQGRLAQQTHDGSVDLYARTSPESAATQDPPVLEEADGDIDVQVTISEWNDDGEPAVEQWDGWFASDGTFVERVDGSVDREMHKTYENGNLTRREYDVDLDGSMDVTIDYTYFSHEYLDTPRYSKVSIDGVFDNDMRLVEAQDGTPDDITNSQFRVLDSDARVIVESLHRDIGNDGTDELVVERFFDEYGRFTGYSRDGLVYRDEFETDNPADGVADYRSYIEYDDEGRQSLLRFEANGALRAQFENEYMPCDEL